MVVSSVLMIVSRGQRVDDRDSKLWLKYSSIGLELAVTVILFTYGGFLLDEKTELLPLFTSVGAVFGMIIGFYHVFRSLTRDEGKGGRK